MAYYTTGATGNVTIPSGAYLASGTGSTSYTINTGAGSNGTSWVTAASGPTPSITVSGNAKFDGDIEWKGKDLGKLLESIEKRLAILTPNPNKLEKYEALQKAYAHYKLLEALCHEDEDDKRS
jgi:hypothetical protein